MNCSSNCESGGRGGGLCLKLFPKLPKRCRSAGMPACSIQGCCSPHSIQSIRHPAAPSGGSAGGCPGLPQLARLRAGPSSPAQVGQGPSGATQQPEVLPCLQLPGLLLLDGRLGALLLEAGEISPHRCERWACCRESCFYL